jgi:hypothetical protein
MGHGAKKTEHAGAKKGCGAYWGRKVAAKKESNRVRREVDKVEVRPEADGSLVHTISASPPGRHWPEIRNGSDDAQRHNDQST